LTAHYLGIFNFKEDIMLQINTKAKGALFTVKADERKDNGPSMTGHFEANSQKISIAAFLKVSKESGKDYLNLKMGEKDGPIFYGKLFRNTDKKGEKSPDYSGYVELGIGDDVPQLRIAGWRMKSRDQKTSYISLELAPPIKKTESECDNNEINALPL
jgi:uncharacterized protein (DUF736 family)